MIRIPLLATLVILFGPIFQLYAYEEPRETPTVIPQQELDKRLPPVLPGEEVVRGGKKIKVWSSAGPVPVADEPEPWNDSEKTRSILNGNNSSIIVDTRK